MAAIANPLATGTTSAAATGAAATPSKWKTPLLTADYKKKAEAELKAKLAAAAQPKGYWQGDDSGCNMNNLPQSIQIDSTTWTRTAHESARGCFCYGSQGGTSADIANNPHYTVVSVNDTSIEIDNVHYTVPNTADPTKPTRVFYSKRNKAYNSAQPMSNDHFIALKSMVDKLLFTWTWMQPQITTSSSASST